MAKNTIIICLIALFITTIGFLENKLEKTTENLEKVSEQYIESHIIYEKLWMKCSGWDTVKLALDTNSRDKSYWGVPKDVGEYLKNIKAKGDSDFINTAYFYDADMLLGVKYTYLDKVKFGYKLWKHHQKH